MIAKSDGKILGTLIIGTKKDWVQDRLVPQRKTGHWQAEFLF